MEGSTMQRKPDPLSVVFLRFLWTHLPRVYTAYCRIKAALNVLRGRPTIANIRCTGEPVRLPPGNSNAIVTGCYIDNASAGLSVGV